jgi:hypothetical protein
MHQQMVGNVVVETQGGDGIDDHFAGRIGNTPAVDDLRSTSYL